MSTDVNVGIRHGRRHQIFPTTAFSSSSMRPWIQRPQCSAAGFVTGIESVGAIFTVGMSSIGAGVRHGSRGRGCMGRSRPLKPTVAVYVQKPKQVAPPASVPIVEPTPKPLEEEAIMESDIYDKGQGRDHQIVVRELAINSRLHSLGLLETRVTLLNAARVQNGILPRWKWFSDYNSAGNRIWLAWDDDFLDIAIMDIGVQRELWQALCTISGLIGDEPWLVGRDFNAVRDLSEVCCASGDIRLAMNEFNDCILNTGLIALPMRGERFTWHNCSDDGRSLWKRLDRLLANDIWMERWPDVFYDCLTTRTSDHSPLVLRGDCRRPRYLMKLVMLYGAQNDISNVFIAYYQRLLGGDRTDRVMDLRYLRSWARHIITDEEASLLIRPITKDDVKTAVFDIEEDRAPGPDGYSSGFFKAAWPVVGEEITAAVMNFFTTGRLLKQVNATLITLIPKAIPLDKIISGYNQCRPPRCALKVDLRKAYDTVEWNFLLATLQLFGLPTLIGGLRNVSPPHFSLYLNGEGLGLFQLNFADDLILLCKAEEGRLPLRLRAASIWTVNAKRGAWSWRKVLELRGTLLPHIQLKIGTGESLSLWHDPWHNLGPLILRFPRVSTNCTAPMAALSVVIEDNMWS
ncbi:hypothetical protein Sango_3033000 [Sesamum angolense]|uniref:Reverse transcriptase domain-containing protein n=1 Tax=Sesamum angolense TaxID=2727404 RepID=A0AAE1W1B4_9LAMI|nr:hypothetical protein Sango_3033000 [Sesamum angolense]